VQEDPAVPLSRLGLRPPPEDEGPLRAYLGMVGQALDILSSLPMGETAPAVAFCAPVAEE